MAVYERRDAAGNVVERAFVPSARPGRDAQVREWAMAGLYGWAPADEAEQKAKESPPSRPAKSALKPAWVDWAVAQGADRAEAEKASKDDLIAAYGDADATGDGDTGGSDPSPDGDQGDAGGGE